MTGCEFSEFTYGYACIREAERDIRRRQGSVGMPIQPSLRDEKGVGWDVAIPAIDYALFLQFKRTYFVSRRRHNSPTWPHLPLRHYRFGVDTSSDQFAALSALEATIRIGMVLGEVYYVAPVFHKQESLGTHYANWEVLANSVLVPPRDFPSDRAQHWFATVSPSGPSCILTEPLIPKGTVRWQALMERVDLRLTQQEATPFSVADLERRLRTVAERERISVPDWMYGEGDPLERLELLSALFGCALVLFPTSDSRAQ